MGGRLIIFDVGGVLRDSSQAMLEGYRRGFASVGIAINLSAGEIWHLRGLGKYNDGRAGTRAILAITRAGINIEEVLKKEDAEHIVDSLVDAQVSEYDKKDIDAAYAIYKHFFSSDEARSMIMIYPDVKESIRVLREKGYLLAVFSNASRASLERDLADLGLDNFAQILSEEDVRERKPSGEGILKILEALKVEGKDAYYVGDAPTDIIAAKNAGVKSIAITIGMGLQHNLEREMPDYIFGSLTEMCKSLAH